VVRECLSWLGYITPIVIGATEKEAERRFADFIEHGGAGPMPGRLGAPQTWAAEWSRRELARATGSVVGTPAQIIEHFQRMGDAGAQHARAVLVGAAGAPEEQDEALATFLEEVLPALDPTPLPSDGSGRPAEAHARP
jgi:alkanesulfonate monooxygenase SsuD/methylene tetrahydromethanopterin reductase-like flavin-dependent oxidoreductase (luciferase family)